MGKNLSFFLLPIALLGISFSSLVSEAEPLQATRTGGKGAKIYCFMRNSGNNHQVSWDAAYAVIKRQSNNLFKTSPKHGAVMITESVVNNPDEYENCGNFLGDLFSKEEVISNSDENQLVEKNNEALTSEKTKKSNLENRYDY